MLKSIDLNYGFNGEVSTASLSYSGSTIAGKAVPTGSPINIDSILKGFRIFRISKTNEAGFITNSEEYVDEGAQKLESIAVLVRGITSSPYSDWQKFYGKMYNFAETNLVNIGQLGEKNPKKINDNLLIIGRTISVVTTSIENDQYYKFYSGKLEVGRSPKGSFSDEVEEKFKNLDVTASLKHGYYLRDFYDALILFGYSVTGFPTEDNFTLIETGGSLRDCLSSIASTYGLYWMCRGYEITFFSKAQVITAASSIEDKTTSTDVSIVSTSYSEDLFGKTKIGVIKGSASETGTKSNSSGGGNGSGNEVKNKNIGFRLVKTKDILPNFTESDLNLVRAFYSFFLFSGGEELFNYMFLIGLFNDFGGIKTSKLAVKYLLSNTLINPTKVGINSFNEANKNEINKHVKSDNEFYSLRTTQKDIELPTRNNVYQTIKAVCEIYGSIYVSRPVSEYTSKKYSLSASDGYQVSQPYLYNTKIKNIPELASYYTAVSGILDNTDDLDKFTIKQMAEKAFSVELNEGESFTLFDGYYYIAFRTPKKENATFVEAQEAMKTVTSSGDAMPPIPLEILSKKLLATSIEREGKMNKVIATSVALVTQIESSSPKAFKLPAIKLAPPEKDDTSSSGDDLSNDDKTELLGSSEIKTFGIDVFSGGDLSTVDIVTLDCNIDEASFLQKEFKNISPISLPQKSSNISYVGFIEPPASDSTLSSYGITISDSSIRTSIGRSSKEILAIDQSIIMANYTAGNSKNINKQYKARQKNLLGLN